MSFTEKEEEAARDLFMMDGWKNLIEEVEDQIELCNLDACNSVEDLFFQKGRLAALRMFANYENYVVAQGEVDDDPTFN
jgi:hypothetical protein